MPRRSALALESTGDGRLDRALDSVRRTMEQRIAGAGTSITVSPGYWATPAPTTAEDAINRLASAVYTLTGSPIP